MSRNAWLTVDDLPAERTTRTITVPDDDAWLAILRGCLYLLTVEENYELFGTLTPAEMADEWRDMFFEFLGDGEDSMLSIDRIIVSESLAIGAALEALSKLHLIDSQIIIDEALAGPLFATSKFNSQGVAWSSVPALQALILQGGGADRPEISWYRGGRTYPEGSIRQHITSDSGLQLWVSTGLVTPILAQSWLMGAGVPFSMIGNGVAAVSFGLDGGGGQVRDLTFKTAGVNRWIIRTNNTAESGSNVGSDWEINARADDGSALGSSALFIKRSTQHVGLGLTAPLAKLHVTQAITTAAVPTLWLRQTDLSEEFIRFETTVGAGNPIEVSGGVHYARVYVNGVGAKYLPLLDTVGSTFHPVGMITQFGGAAAPAGWLLCDGAAVSRTTYAALFAVIGTTHGAGNGTTTFNVPNIIGSINHIIKF